MKIELAGVTKRFGPFAALADVDVEIGSGELVALLGPSGSGKTTLLRIIAGLEWPDQGRVSFGGVDALARSVRERRVGFVFQHYALFRHLTVFENVAFGLRVRPRRLRLDEAAIKARVDRLLDLVQLRWVAGRHPDQLSGGQRQRIALARALAIEPDVLLLDEPFGALDARVRKQLRRWLRDLHDAIHVTSVFVTHDQEEALEVADRVVVMDRGRIEQIGTPEDVYTRPATSFVHEFIGDSVVIPVAVALGRLHFDGRRLELDAQGVEPGAARLVVRPADMIVGPAGSGPLSGTVKRMTGVAAGRRIEIDLEGAHTIEIDGATAPGVTVGETIGLRPARYRVYPADAARPGIDPPPAS